MIEDFWREMLSGVSELIAQNQQLKGDKPDAGASAGLFHVGVAECTSVEFFNR